MINYIILLYLGSMVYIYCINLPTCSSRSNLLRYTIEHSRFETGTSCCVFWSSRLKLNCIIILFCISVHVISDNTKLVTRTRECLSNKPLLVIPRPQSLPSVSNYLHFGHQIPRYGLPRLRRNLPQESSQLRRPNMTILLLPHPLNLLQKLETSF